MEPYTSAFNSPKTSHVTERGPAAPRPSFQALLAHIDTTGPAWPHVAAALREMADAGVGITPAVCEIAAKVGAHRFAAAKATAHHGRRPANYQATLTGTSNSIVYYIRREGFIKIGTTADPMKRFTGLMPEKILAFEPGGIELETMRHRQFSHLRRTRSEYFAAGPELLEHIRQVRCLHGDPDPAWPSIASQKTRYEQARFPGLVSHETVTARQASERLGISRQTVWHWARTGRISQAGTDGRGRLFYAEHLLALKAQRRPRHKPPSATDSPRDS